MAEKKFFIDINLQGSNVTNLKADTLDITTNSAASNAKRIVYWSDQYYYSDGTSWIALGGSGNIPTGGATGDILAKASGTDYDVEWIENYTSNVKHEVKAGVALSKGQAVYVSSASGTNMIVSKASNASESTSSKTMGLIASSAALNDIIFVITEGLLTGTGSAPLNTSTATEGDPVWLGTNGNLIFGLANKPVAPAHLVFLGIVTRVSSTVGEIFVKVQNGYELGEIHDVLISSPVSGQILKLDSDSLWKNWTPDYVSGTGTANYLTKYTGTSTIGINSLIYDTGSKIGVGITTPSALFHINNTSASDSFLVEDETNPDATPFVIKSDGRVGLGITDPVAKLDIVSPAISGGSETLLRIRVSDDLNSGFSIYNATGADGIFVPTFLGENSTDKRPLYLIGKGATDTGTEPLVSFDARIGFNNPVVTRPAFLFTNNGTSLLNILANGDIGIGITNPTAKLHITHTNESDAFKVEDSTNPDASPFVIDKDGNVGIGNPSPGGTAAKVTIQSSDTEGTVRLGGGNGAGNARLFLQSSATDAYIDMYGNSQYLPLRIDAGPLSLNSSAGSGNVGIGTSTPSTKLEVNGDLKVSTIVNATTNTGKILVSDGGIVKYRTAAETISDILTVTNTGTNGAATLTGTTLNIPVYEGSLIPKLQGNEIWRGSTFRNNSTTIDTTAGIVLSTSGTNTARSVGTTSYATRSIRLGVTASITALGRYSGMRGSALLWYVTGGFLYTGEFNISDTATATGTHNFWGVASSTADLAIGGSNNDQPSALTNIIAFANDSGDANLQIMHNDASGTATKTDLGASFPSNRTAGAAITTIYSCYLYNAPGSTDVIYRIVNKETGAVAQGTLNTNLPASTVGLNFFGVRTMGTSGGGINNSGQFDVYRLGVYSL
jgi:hypothetical protein